jgi:hypothetical protein
MIDKVETIFDFWDCPRKGIASYEGNLHLFECVFDEITDEYSNVYRLKIVSSELLQLITEEENLRINWDNKRIKTEEDKATYPILLEDKKRFELITTILETELSINESNSFAKIAKFTLIEYMASYNVEWKEV